MATNTHANHAEHEDAWRHHEASEGNPMAGHQINVNTFAILKWLVIIVGFTAASIAFIVIYFNQYHRRLRETTVETVVNADYVQYRTSADAALGTSSGQYKALPFGKVQLPVQAAMEKVQAKYAKGSVQLTPLHAGTVGAK